MVKKERGGVGRIFVKVKTLHTKISYKVALVDRIQLSGMFVLLTHRKRWNFKLLVKKKGGWLGALPRISQIITVSPPDMRGIERYPREKSTPETHSSG